MRKNNKLISTCIMALLIVIFSLNTAVSSFAGQWNRDGMGWWYQNDDGSYPAGQWSQINGLWYYFGSGGYLLQESYTPHGYYVNADGVWIPNYVRYDRINLNDIVDFNENSLLQYELRENLNIMVSIGALQGGEDDGKAFAQIGSWYGILSRTYWYEYGGIALVFEDKYNPSNQLILEWYGMEAIDYPQVTGYGACEQFSGDYTYGRRIGEGMQ